MSSPQHAYALYSSTSTEEKPLVCLLPSHNSIRWPARCGARSDLSDGFWSKVQDSQGIDESAGCVFCQDPPTSLVSRYELNKLQLQQVQVQVHVKCAVPSITPLPTVSNATLRLVAINNHLLDEAQTKWIQFCWLRAVILWQVEQRRTTGNCVARAGGSGYGNVLNCQNSLDSSQKCHWRTEGGRRDDGVFCSAALFRRSDVPKRLVQCRLWNMTPTPDFYRKESMCTAVPSLEYLFIDQCRSFSRNFVNEIRKILQIIKPLQKDLNYSESSFQRFQDQMTCVF